LHIETEHRRSLVVEQLTTLDAGFLEAEDSDRHVSLAIGGLAVIDGPAPDYDALVATLAERVPSIPRFTQVPRMHLFDLGAPEWVDDDRFDIAHHVHRRALPQPGDDAALFRLVAEIMECPPGQCCPGPMRFLARRRYGHRRSRL
jgi:diacylglycerol O-acyltransferase